MTQTGQSPREERLAGLMVGIEGTAMVLAGIGFAIAAVVGQPDDEGTALLLGGLLALYGAGVVVVARGLLRRRRWARTPALLVQFFALVVAWYQRSTLPVVAVIVAVIAVATAVPLLRTLADDGG